MTTISNTGLGYYTVRNSTQYYNPLITLSGGLNFVFAGKQTPWNNDADPPTPNTSVQNIEYKIYDDMIFGKIIAPGDVSLMINRYNWTSGTVYTAYNDQDANLFNEPFYVVSPENGNYYVFKCLDNNGRTPSTSPPLYSFTSSEETYYETSDGYVWKYMYTITGEVWNDFATTDYVPLIIDPLVQQNAVNGSIEAVLVNVAGNNFVSYTNGQFQGFIINNNNLVYAIDNSTSLQITLANVIGSFIIGETVTQGSNTGVVALYSAPFLQLSNINGQFGIAPITGLTSNATGTPISLTSAGPSSNNGFYNQCSVYIQSGTGVGQIRTIESFQVVGTQRQITINSPFTVTPDSTSHYLICPQVIFTGDGQGAQAISFVNTSTYSIEGIKMINVGTNYSYCNIDVVGNTGLYGIGSEYYGFSITDGSGSFQIGEGVTEGNIATGTVLFANSSVVRIIITGGTFSTAYEEFGIGTVNGSFIQGETVTQNGISGVINVISSSYISLSGVTGGIFDLDDGPITGQTSNAFANLVYASSLIGGTSNARATILTLSSSAAQVQAIISPRGGHGFDPASELGANKVGVSVIFNNNEGNTIPCYGIGGNTQYRNIGILQQPLLANVQLTINNASGSMQIGETCLQYISSVNTDSVSIANISSYHYVIGNYVKLTVSNSSSFVVNNEITQIGITPATGLVINQVSNTIIVRTDSGAFTNGTVVELSSNALVNCTVEAIAQGFTNSVFGNDGSNNIFASNTLTSYIQFFVNNVEFPDFTYLLSTANQESQHANSTAISVYNYTLSNNDIVTINQFVPSTILSNSQYAAAGVITFANASVIYLTNVNNIFEVGSTVIGATSLQTANVQSITSPTTTFNQTTQFYGTYNTANTFLPGVNVYQFNPLGVTGSGIVQGVVQGANSTTFIVSVTDIKGLFQSGAGYYLGTASNTVNFLINSIVEPQLVQYSGNVIYIENIEPITRANTQNEVNKIVLNFS